MAEESFQNNFFDTEYLKADLKGRSVRGGAVTMAAQGVRFFLQMGSTVVLARLLTPQDFGLIAMVTAVTGFVVMFKDMGLSMATVQKAEINHGQISTLFWINVVLSLGVMLVIAALAPAIAWFYGEPRLTWITLALAGAFIFGGLTVQHQALLRRNMRFGSLALIQIISMSVGILTAIIAAFYGAGYWSLVLMQLATAITSAIAVWVACGWRPDLPVRGSAVRPMLAFGGHLTGFNLINYFTRNLDNILIGCYCGSAALGLYAKAYQIVYMPLTNVRNPINAVAIPVLSSLKNEPERFRRYYGKIVFVLAIFSMPLMAFCVMFAEELIQLIFGEQWLAMTDVFRLLAIAGFIQPVTGTRGALLIACGQSKLYLIMGAVAAVLFVTGFCIGIIWGVIGVAASIVFVVYAIQYPMFFIAFRYVPGSFRELLGNCWYVALLSWLSVLCAKGIVMFIPGLENLSLLWGSLAMTVVFFGMFLGISFSRKNLQENFQILKKGFSANNC